MPDIQDIYQAAIIFMIPIAVLFIILLGMVIVFLIASRLMFPGLQYYRYVSDIEDDQRLRY